MNQKTQQRRSIIRLCSVILFFLLLIPTGAKAEEPQYRLKGFKAFVNLNTNFNVFSKTTEEDTTPPSFPISEPTYNNIGLSATLGYQFNNHVFVGGGMLVEYYIGDEGFSFPLYADCRVNLLDRPTTPYVDVKLGGYFWSCSMAAVSALYNSYEVGMRIGLDKGKALNCALLCTFYPRVDSGSFIGGATDRYLNLGLSVGYEF